ncbi:MAG: xanthine dehydrogenase family protein subunit M [Acidimicrobiales bacterium]|nr:xanthine dehydrogenase family protein subunit M [Acidimicrobiales bacterium]MDG2217996.1 xanthine dehydrogenase family protein subunit M [Acidimicrobiales bacterium]
MKNPPFEYHCPGSLNEAVTLLAELGDDAKILAGGQSLLPVMALRLGTPPHIIDIGGLTELADITVGSDGVTIGATVRHRAAETSDNIARHAPLVAAALPHVGHRAIRTRGTVLGSIAHADPAAEMPAVCLATGATMVARSVDGEREIAAADFFEGYLTTVLHDNEILTHVRFPAWPATAGAAVVEISRRHGDYALVGLACKVDVTEGEITSAALSFLGVSGTPVRVTRAEQSLVGKPPGDTVFATAADIVTATLEPGGDIHATANYRRHIAGVLTRRGLAEATARIGVPA